MMFGQNFPASIATPAESIDEVIDQLTAIVEWSKSNNSRLGYFAALYRKVTIQVKKGIEDNFFDNGPRMERLDVIFANRYVHACYQYLTGQTPTQSWVRAFDATERWWPIVLQHLLMGMNAHINLDLGIAAAETVVPPEPLQDLKNDFDKINQMLADLVGGVQEELAAIWPILGIMNRYLGSVEKAVINFSMEKARDAAWSFAEELYPLSTESRDKAIAQKDEFFAVFSNVIMHPGIMLSAVIFIVRLGERGTIRTRIEILE
ncbi:MAG: DUF5995 family protein [Gammaproteobacteria bacterium]